MRIVFFVILFAFSQLHGQSGHFLILNSEVDESLSKLSKKKSDLFIVNIDYNDCINCNSAIYLFNKSNKNTAETYYVFSGVPDFKIPNLIKKLGLSDSINIIKDNVITGFMAKSFNVPGSRSVILRYSQSKLTLYSYLKELTDEKHLNYFLSGGLNMLNEHLINDSMFFYTNISSFKVLDKGIAALTNPEGQLLLIDSQYVAVKALILDTVFLQQKVYQKFISKYPDSIKKINPFNTVMKSYREDIEPFGMGIFSFNDIDVADSSIFISSYVSLPILENPNRVIFDGQGYIIKTNKDFSRVEPFFYDFTEKQSKYLPLAMYGFSAKKDKKFVMALTNKEILYNDTVYKYKDSVLIMGEWKMEDDEFKQDMNFNSPFILEKDIRKFLVAYKDLALKHYSISDSLIYFKFMPYVMNLKTNRLYQIFDTLAIKQNNSFYSYKNYLTFAHPTTHNIISIEEINGKVYLSKFGLGNKREKIFLLNIGIADNPVFSFDGNTLYTISTKKKSGSYISSLPISYFTN